MAKPLQLLSRPLSSVPPGNESSSVHCSLRVYAELWNRSGWTGLGCAVCVLRRSESWFIEAAQPLNLHRDNRSPDESNVMCSALCFPKATLIASTAGDNNRILALCILYEMHNTTCSQLIATQTTRSFSGDFRCAASRATMREGRLSSDAFHPIDAFLPSSNKVQRMRFHSPNFNMKRKKT